MLAAGRLALLSLLLLLALAAAAPAANDIVPERRPLTSAAPRAGAAVGSALVTITVDHAHIRLGWPSVPGALRYAVRRGGLLVAELAGTSTVDVQLWPATTYRYAVEAIGAGGEVLRRLEGEARTAVLPTGGVARPFAADSPWNAPVAGALPHPRGVAIAARLAAAAGSANLSLRRWAVAVAEVRPGDALHAVPCVRYANCTLGLFGAFPIPLTARADPTQDGHLAVIDPVTQREWGMYRAASGPGGWTAGAGAAVSLTGQGRIPPGTTGGNAANFPLLAGLLRPEEILQGRIDHALVFGAPGVSRLGHVCPATKNDGSSTAADAPQEGMRFQLDPAVDVDRLSVPAWQKTIARALQTYGMYLRDDGSSLSLYAENPISRGYDAWSLVGLPSGGSASLSGLPWDRLRLVSAPC